MPINIIAACDLNRGIGFKNQLLCKLSSDLQNFKKLTENHFVLMGRKTYQSVGKPLPNRTNIVLTRKPNKLEFDPEVITYGSVEEVLFEYENYAEKDVELWVIGGSDIYSQFLDHADRVYLTVIRHEFKQVDSYFPELDESQWDKKFLGEKKIDEKDEYTHSYTVYTRKQTN